MLEIRRRVNVKKLTKGEWTFDCTIEVSGSDADWFLAHADPLADGDGEASQAVVAERANGALAQLIADTCDVAAGEIKRQLDAATPQ